MKAKRWSRRFSLCDNSPERTKDPVFGFVSNKWYTKRDRQICKISRNYWQQIGSIISIALMGSQVWWGWRKCRRIYRVRVRRVRPIGMRKGGGMWLMKTQVVQRVRVRLCKGMRWGWWRYRGGAVGGVINGGGRTLIVNRTFLCLCDKTVDSFKNGIDFGVSDKQEVPTSLHSDN